MTKEDQGYEGSHCDPETQCVTNGAYEELNLGARIVDQSGITRPQECDHAHLQFKRIAKVYEKCNICIIELENFEEVAKDKSWQKAMESEISMIDKNST